MSISQDKTKACWLHLEVLCRPLLYSCSTSPFLWSCSTPNRHMDLSISVMYISKQHCSWMKSLQISGWISPSSGL